MEVEYLGKCIIIKIENKINLIVGDLHLGFEQALENSGTLIGRRMFKEMVEEFDLIFEQVKKRGLSLDKVIFLGDIKHEFFELSQQERGDLTKLIDYLESKMDKGNYKIVFIKGNHDNYLLNLRTIGKVEVCDHLIMGDCCFLHGDKDFVEAWDKKINYWIMGHLHPAVKIKDYRGVRVEKYKCFLEGEFKGKKVIVLPSFNPYSEGSDMREERMDLPWEFEVEKFNVKIVGENLKVLDFGKLGKL
ncbi:MAG: metallophosphoesterase [Nanoarchaeota archaeon]|nr:metallophosphoesterase [Nanoarchaeota archaeon]